jgi:hypothetical protein
MTKEDLAQSLMEKEALAKMGAKEGTALEAYNKLKKKGLSDEQIATKLGDKKLSDQLKSKSIQEKFSASVERMKEMFVAVGSALMPIVSGIASGVAMVSTFIAKWSGLIKILGSAWLIMKGMKMTSTALLSINKAIAGYNKTMLMMKARGNVLDAEGNVLQTARAGLGTTILTTLGLQNAQKSYQAAIENKLGFAAGIRAAMEQTTLGSLILQGGALIKNAAKGAILLAQTVARAAAELIANASLTFGLGVIIALAAAAAGIAYLYSISKPKKTGDMSSAADGKTQVSTKEGGLFELSPNDDLVAAPGAVDKMNQKGGGGTQNNSALVARIDQLIATTQQVVNINQQILAKSPVIEMGGNEVGQGINKAEREIQ